MNLPCILQKTKEHSGFKGHQAEKNLLSHHIHIKMECNEFDLILQSLSRQNLQRYHTERFRVWLGKAELSASRLHTRQGERLYISYSSGYTTLSNFVYLET